MSSGAPPSDAAAYAVQYSIVFVNNSTNFANACIYQQDPDLGVPSVQSLAWFTKPAYPTTKLSFSWTLSYYFVWSETGPLGPGAVFMASQAWPADLSTTNMVTLTKEGGAYTFQGQGPGPTPGRLNIMEDGTIPSNQAAVGIGMSGAATFVVQAQPNWQQVFTPSPQPQYWITFGNFMQGEVMDDESLMVGTRVEFPVNIYSMTATINPDNTWTVVPTATMNAHFIENRARLPEEPWGTGAVRPGSGEGRGR